MQCTTCGKEIADTAKFCPYCGSKTEPIQDSVPNDAAPEYTDAETIQPETGNKPTEPGKLIQIGLFVLAGFCGILALQNLFSAIQFFSFSAAMRGLGTLLCMACYAGMAAMLAMIGISKEKEKNKIWLIVLSGAAAVIILCDVIVFISSTLERFRYYFSFFGFLTDLCSLLVTVILMAAIIVIAYTLMQLSGFAPDLSHIINAGASKASNAQSPNMAQGSANAEANYNEKKAETNYENQNSNMYDGGQNMETNYNNQGQNYNNPGGNQNYNNPRPGAMPLKTDRNLLVYILLSIVTCGIYGYYFIYSVASDVNTACAGDGKSTGGLIQFILLSFITCGIYAWWWEYSLGNRLAENAPRYGMHFAENGTTILMWLIFGWLLCGIGPFIAMHIIIKNTNSICMAYNRYNKLI